MADDEGEVVGTSMLLIAPSLSHNALPWAVIENIVVDEGYDGCRIDKLLMIRQYLRLERRGAIRYSLAETNGARRYIRFITH